MKLYKRLYSVFAKAVTGWMQHNAVILAAALAFYTAISLAPLLTMILYISGIFWGDKAAAGFLVDQIASLTDKSSATFIQSLIARANESKVGPFAGAVSFLVLLWGSTRLFAQLQIALNVVWEVGGPEGEFRKQVTRLAKQRLLAFGMTLVVAFILLVSLVFDALVAFASKRFNLPGQDWLWGTANDLISLIIVWTLFAFIYKVLPMTAVRFKDAFMGALVAAALFTIGKGIFGLYLAHQQTVYGASASLMGILLWVYFSAQALFFGAEVAKAWGQSKSKPDGAKSESEKGGSRLSR